MNDNRIISALVIVGIIIMLWSVRLSFAQEDSTLQPNTVSPAEQANDPDSLMRKAQDEGTVRILVSLHIPVYKAEGSLPEGQSVSRQRTMIADAQDSVMAELSGLQATTTARFRYIPLLGLEVDADALAVVYALPEVANVVEEVALPLALDTSIPVIGANRAWAGGLTGSGQTVAVLDTGVDPLHPMFANKIIYEECFSTSIPAANRISVCPGYTQGAGSAADCIDQIAPIYANARSGCDHGTHVAGIAVGNDGAWKGVAPDATLISMQVFALVVDNNGNSCGSTTNNCLTTNPTDYIAALERIYELRNTFNIVAVNLSFGGGAFLDDCDWDPTKVAVDLLRSVDIATVVATGNDGHRVAVGIPACISSVVSVGNTTDNDLIATSSNIAPFVSVLAPGTGITSSVPIGSSPTGYGTKSGTSMAAPHVTGSFALTRQAYTNDSVSDTLGRLQLTGTLVDDQRDAAVVTGMRRINVDLAAAPGVYVNGTAPPQAEDGSPTFPFDSIEDGVISVPTNGYVWIVPGTYFETLPISRPMILRSTGGQVVVGSQNQ